MQFFARRDDPTAVVSSDLRKGIHFTSSSEFISTIISAKLNVSSVGILLILSKVVSHVNMHAETSNLSYKSIIHATYDDDAP